MDQIITALQQQPATTFFIAAIIGLLSTIVINQNTLVKEQGASKLLQVLHNAFETTNRWYTKQAWALVVTMLIIAVGVYLVVDVHPRSIFETPYSAPALSISFLIGGLLTVWVGQVALRTTQLSALATLHSLQHLSLQAGFRTAWLRGALPILFGLFFMIILFTIVVWPSQLPVHWMYSRTMADHLLAMALGATVVTVIRNLITGVATNALLSKLSTMPDRQSAEDVLVQKTVRSSLFGSLWTAKWVQTFMLVMTALLMTSIMHRSIAALSITMWSLVIGSLITLGVSMIIRKHARYSLHQSLKYGLIISGLLLLVAMFWVSLALLPGLAPLSNGVFWQFFLAFSTGVLGLYLIIGVCEYYTQATFAPINKLMDALQKQPESSSSIMTMLTLSAAAWSIVFLLCLTLVLGLLGGVFALPWALLGAAMLSLFVAIWCVLPCGGYIASFAAPIGRMPAEVRARANELSKEADSAHTISLIALGIISTITHLVLVWNWLHLRGSLFAVNGIILGVLCGFIVCGALIVYLLQLNETTRHAVRKNDLKLNQHNEVRMPSINILRSIEYSPFWIILMLLCALVVVGTLFGSSAILGMMLCIILLSGVIFSMLSMQSGMARQAYWGLRHRRQDASVKAATKRAELLERTTHDYLETVGLPLLSIVSTLTLLLWVVSWMIPMQGFAV